LRDFTGSFTVKGGVGLVKHYIMLTRVIHVAISQSKVRLTILFIRKLYELYKHQGLPGMVKHTKALYVCTVQSLGDYIIKDVGPLGARVSRNLKGLPRFYPVSVRKLMTQGDPSTIRWVLTILALSRSLEYLTQPKLSTITDPFTGSIGRMNYWSTHIPKACEMLGLGRYQRKIKPIDFRLIFTSSPNSLSSKGEFSSSPIATLRSLYALGRIPLVLDSLLFVISKLGVTSNFKKLFGSASLTINDGYFDDLTDLENQSPLYNRIGKLGLKQEPQGKVRIFAMVDPWTQMVLYPIHK